MEANAKVLAHSKFPLDPMFEHNDLKANQMCIRDRDTFWQYIATGLIIVFAVYVDVIQGKLAAMRLNKKAKAE